MIVIEAILTPPPPGGAGGGGSKWPKKNLSVFWGLDTIIRRGRKKMFGHFDTHQVWSIIEVSRGFWQPRPKHLGQRYTILQTFWPFGYDIFKIPKRQNHLDSSITWWLWLRPKYLGQWYTMLQTFRPFGYDILKIPKCHNQLRFWFKLARVAWYHVSHGYRWFQAISTSLKHNRSSPKVLATEGTPKQPYHLCFQLKLAPTTWNHVSHGDIWFQALGTSLKAYRRFPKGFKSPRETHRSPTKHFFWISDPGKHI